MPSSSNNSNRGSTDAQTNKRRIWFNMYPQPLPGDSPDFFQESKTLVFASNEIHTRKYTIITFIPKNLFEQFRGLANFYFLSLVILQLFPIFQFVAPIITSVPLLIIVGFTAIKDAIEDIKRHNADKEVNRSPVYQMTRWKNTNFRKLSDDFSFGRLAVRLKKIENAMINAMLDLSALSFHCCGKGRVSDFERTPEYISPDLYVEQYEAGDERPIQSSTRSDSLPLIPRDNPSLVPEMCWRRRKWKDVRVGDFVFLTNNEQVPADIVIISTSEEDGMCYLETKNLDGETNLKIRKGVARLSNVRTPTDCRYIKGYLDSEIPNANLFAYNGALVLNPDSLKSRKGNSKIVSSPSSQKIGRPWTSALSHQAATEIWEVDTESMECVPLSTQATQVPREETIPITLNGVLLRGCMLRNTKWVIGVVFATGVESKIMLNSGATPSKRSRIEKMINFQLFINVLILIGLSVICTIGASLYMNVFQEIHLTVPLFSPLQSPLLTGVTVFVLSLILFQTIIPIALFISFEACKSFQSYLIHLDDDMYDPESNKHVSPQSWNLCDELGQIEYIFSDKTGTLTSNTMEFRKASIDGILYGNSLKGDSPAVQTVKDKSVFARWKVESEISMRQGFKQIFDTKYLSPTLTFLDPTLPVHLKATDEHAGRLREFFTLLAVCHTVLVDRVDSKTLLYKAQSPDEAALVKAAKDCGFAFLGRQNDIITVDVMGIEKKYQILNVIEFNSDRKRMSVIIRRPEKDVLLLCKGADSVIFQRLGNNVDKKLQQLTLSHLDAFANEGLRTLCLAYRYIPENVYNTWNTKYYAAQSLIVNREATCDLVAEEIEQNLMMLGATAIEDKLQDGVPECIATLAKAGIKLWVLTGDKVETAINIGFSCNLLTRSMLLILVQASTLEDTERQLVDALNRFWDEKGSAKEGTSHALVIDGNTLKFGLELSLKPLLLELGSRCKAVLCCRVSPLQKAMVVELVRKGLGAMCLAIGDGANDVSMIQAADVGVGISGKEGLQAAMSSDYAISQFRFLSKLLLVHGRWAYLRTTNMSLNYFYKNVVMIGVLFWFQFFSCFSASLSIDFTYTVYYSTIFTFLPTLYIGILDQDLNDRISLQIPQLYLKGIMQTLFGIRPYWMHMANAFFQSIIIYYIAIFCIGEGVISPSGRDHGIVSLGTLTGFALVFTVNIACTGSTSSLNYLGIWAFWLVNAIWLVYALTYVAAPRDGSNEPLGLLSNLLTAPVFYFNLALSLVTCLLPMFLFKFIQREWFPNDTDIIQEVQKFFWQVGYSIELDKKEDSGSLGVPTSSYSMSSAGNVSEAKSDTQVSAASVPEVLRSGTLISDTDIITSAPASLPSSPKKEPRVRSPSQGLVSVSDMIRGSVAKASEFVRRLKTGSESKREKGQYKRRSSIIHMANGAETTNSGFAFSQSTGMSKIIAPARNESFEYGAVDSSSALASTQLSPRPKRTGWWGFRGNRSMSPDASSPSKSNPSSPTGHASPSIPEDSEVTGADRHPSDHIQPLRQQWSAMSREHRRQHRERQKMNISLFPF